MNRQGNALLAYSASTGGNARAKALTPERRAEIARKAASARHLPRVAHQYKMRERAALLNPRPPLPSLDGCTVRAIQAAQARPIILKYEWLGTMGRAAACYGLFSPTNELLGVSCFGWPSSPESRDVCGEENRPLAVCLERGACVHWAPRNAASFLIRRAVGLAHAEHGWAIFYAYADPSAGEIGAIYQALNWYYIGQGVGREPGRTRDRFVRPDGRVVSDRALTHAGVTIRDLPLGWRRVQVAPKHKYVFFEGAEADALLALCRYPFQPYPKRKGGAA